MILETEKTIHKVYDIQPYGKFNIKWVRREHSVTTLSFKEMDFFESMPLTEEQEKTFIKEMKKHKTDVFTDGGYFNFYTKTKSGIQRIFHPKLQLYRESEGFKILVDES